MSGVRVSQAGIVRIGVAIAGVKPATVRQWIVRGHLTRHPDGFDPDELVLWVETIRNVDQARGAAHAAHVRHQTRRAVVGQFDFKIFSGRRTAVG